MWFEDDVIINNKITDNFNFDLNGFCPNNIPIKILKEKYNFI